MRYRSIVIAGALVATAALAEEKAGQAKGSGPSQGAGASQNSNQPPTADTQKSEPSDPKGYGYGEQPGREAKGSSARQASDPSRAKGKTPQDQRPTPGGETKGPDTSVSGRIVSVSPESVSVRGQDGKEESLPLTRRTVVFRDGQRIEASRLRPGDEVRASFERQGERRVATRITVQSADSAMQQGKAAGESVDTPDQEREGIGGRMEASRPEPEKGGPEGPPSGK